MSVPRNTLLRALGASIAALALGLTGAVIVAAPAAAADITVNNSTDLAVPAANSLRWAVNLANTDSASDDIRLDFAADTTITIDQGTLTLTKSARIINVGAGTVTILLGGDFNLFTIDVTATEVFRNFSFIGGTDDDGTPNLILDGQDGAFSGHGIEVQTQYIQNLWLDTVELREFDGGGSEAGAAVRAPDVDSEFRATNVRVEDNVSAASGGGFYIIDSGAVNITGGYFGNNDAGGVGTGGAIHVGNSGAVTIHGGEYDLNTADGGGAVAVNGSGNVTIDQEADFHDNGAVGLGGALLVDNLNDDPNTVLIEDSTFTGNDANNGGGVFLQRVTTATITDGTRFQNNEAFSRGGGLATNVVNSLDLTDSQWVNNSAGTDGGAVSTVGSGNHLIDLALFDLNSAVNGGAIAVRAPDIGTENEITVANSMIANNDAISTGALEGNGGGVWIRFEQNTPLPINIIGNTFSGNEARNTITGVGGGLFIDRVVELTRIHGNTFTGNQVSPLTGFGVSVAIDYMNGTDAQIDVVNSTFDEAFLPSGAAAPMFYLRAMDAPAVLGIAHSTFVGPLGIQLDAMDGGDGLLTHTALQTTQNAVVWPDGETLDTEWSAFTQGPNPGNINDVVGNRFSLPSLQLGPLQDNGNGLPHTREPLTGSPLINTGDPAVTGAPLYDERGEGFNRIVQVIDIGAVEVQHPQLPATGPRDAAPLAALAALALLAGAVLVFARRRFAR